MSDKTAEEIDLVEKTVELSAGRRYWKLLNNDHLQKQGATSLGGNEM